MADTLVALVGIGGVIVGGTIQYLANTFNERWKYRVQTRTDAYKAFIDSMSRISIFNGMLAKSGIKQMTPEQIERVINYQMDFAGAKTRVALYGSKQVLGKMAVFTSRHAQLASAEDYEAYIDFVEAMRNDSYADNYDGFRQDLDNLMLRGMMV